jgi:hypothetical protein
LILLGGIVRAADWVEVCAPGRSDGGMIGQAAAGVGEQAVEALTPFDGRLYITLQAVPKGQARPIIAYDPKTMDLCEESPTAGRRFGRMRVLDGRLHVPVAEPTGDGGGYYVSAGGGKWEWVAVALAGTAFYDVARFDNKTFLTGRRKDEAIIAWRADGAPAWQVEALNVQAARFSFKASTFLCVSNHLALLAVRDVIGDWPPLVAPRDWGAWYVLSYTGGRSPRGFLFDGPARPLPALRLLAPATSLLQNPKVTLARDASWRDGLLTVLLREPDFSPDPSGGLLFLGVNEGTPQTGGRTFAGRRIAGQEQTRDIAVAEGRCALLLAEAGVSPQARIVVSSDLESWETIFEAELPATPLALAILNGKYYIGLANGGIVMVTKP